MHASTLGIMPPEIVPSAMYSRTVLRLASSDDRRRIVDVGEQARHVGEIDRLLRTECASQRTCDRVGVDVVGLAVGVGTIVETTGIMFSLRSRSTMLGCTLTTSPTKPRAASRGAAVIRPPSSPRAHGVGTVDIDRADDVTTDLADQHHAGDVEGLGVGDPQAVDERRLLAELREKLADLRTAAVHHDGFQADGAKQDDVLCKRLGQCRVHHGVPDRISRR